MLKSKEGTCEVCEVVSHSSWGVLLLSVDPTDDRLNFTIKVLDQLDSCFETDTVQGLEVVAAVQDASFQELVHGEHLRLFGRWELKTFTLRKVVKINFKAFSIQVHLKEDLGYSVC